MTMKNNLTHHESLTMVRGPKPITPPSANSHCRAAAGSKDAKDLEYWKRTIKTIDDEMEQLRQKRMALHWRLVEAQEIVRKLSSNAIVETPQSQYSENHE